jgi:PKD repeat protein
MEMGDGNIENGVISALHTYTQPGAYTVTVTVTAPGFSPSTTTQTVVAFNESPITSAIIGNQYRYVIPVTLGMSTPSLTQTPVWLTINSFGHDDVSDRDYVIVSGVVPVTAVPGSVVPVTLTIGATSIPWTITLNAGPNYPVAGFTTSVSNLTVTVTPATHNVITVSYDMGDGTIRDYLGPSESFTHTYAIAGTYTITQTVSSGGAFPNVEFSRNVTVSEPIISPEPEPEEVAGLNWIGIVVAILLLVLLICAVSMALLPEENRWIFGILAAAAIVILAYILWRY